MVTHFFDKTKSLSSTPAVNGQSPSSLSMRTTDMPPSRSMLLPSCEPVFKNPTNLTFPAFLPHLNVVSVSVLFLETSTASFARAPVHLPSRYSQLDVTKREPASLWLLTLLISATRRATQASVPHHLEPPSSESQASFGRTSWNACSHSLSSHSTRKDLLRG